MKKVVICFCAVVCMVFGCLVPCSAETWEEVSPNYGLPFGTSPTYTDGYNNTKLVIEAVEKATELGLFGGTQPVLILYQYESNNNAMHIMVIAPASNTQGLYTPTDIAWNGVHKMTAYKAGNAGIENFNTVVDTATNTSVPFTMYCLQYSGDWAVSAFKVKGQYVETSTASIGSQTSVIYKKVATWSAENGMWVEPTGVINDKIGWGANKTEFAGIRTIISKYDEQIKRLNTDPDPPPVGSYELDIAGIFNGYFNGVRDILGSYDIDLFGINIIGVLIAVLVITIVAFIVRKLWK